MKDFNHVFKILTELSGVSEISESSLLLGDLGLDSLQMITLMVVLEEEFEIVFNESDMNPYDLISVNDVIMLVQKYLGGSDDEKES